MIVRAAEAGFGLGFVVEDQVAEQLASLYAAGEALRFRGAQR
jgi:hypothetical protein